MTKRVAMIFLVFSLVMIGVSIWGLAAWVSTYAEVDDPQGPMMYVITGSCAVGPWIVLLAVSCLGLGMTKQEGD